MLIFGEAHLRQILSCYGGQPKPDSTLTQAELIYRTYCCRRATFRQLDVSLFARNRALDDLANRRQQLSLRSINRSAIRVSGTKFRYSVKPAAAGIDPLGFAWGPVAYAAGQMLMQAVAETKSLGSAAPRASRRAFSPLGIPTACGFVRDDGFRYAQALAELPANLATGGLQNGDRRD